MTGMSVEVARAYGAAESRPEDCGAIRRFLKSARESNGRYSVEECRLGASLVCENGRSMPPDERWLATEQVAVAAMDVGRLEVAETCVGTLKKQFPGSVRVGKLEGMLLESAGKYEEAKKKYDALLEANPGDISILKRKVALEKTKGNVAGAIDALTKYLDTYMADAEAWHELGDLYLSLHMYKQAAFCYEELLLSSPSNHGYVLLYAETLYTLGGYDNLYTAFKYFSLAVDLSDGDDAKSLYGLAMCSLSLSAKGGKRHAASDGENVKEIGSLTARRLVQMYKERAPGMVKRIEAAFASLLKE